MKSLLFFASVAVALLSACGGGGSGSGPANPQPAGISNTTVQVNLGDAPADRLLAVAMSVETMTFTRENGSPVPVLGSPRPIEMMQLLGTVTPLALSGIPQGTYTGATMTFGNANVTHVDVSGQVMHRSVPGTMNATMTFNPPLTIGAMPMVVNVDMDMAASVYLDANGNATMTPHLTAHANPLLAGSRHPEDGGMHGLTGTVGSLQGGAFTLAMTQGLGSASMATHAGTHYAGLAGTHMMTGNMLVTVDAMPQADGTWIVNHVQSGIGASGAMAAGVVTAITGDPPTQVTIVMHDGAGNGMLGSELAATATVNVSTSTQFGIEARDVDLTGLPFTPQFDRTHLSKGQAIKAWSTEQIGHGHGTGGMHGGDNIAASLIQLKHQGLRGTVSGYGSNGTQASFTLTVPADAAFAKLTGSTAVTVYQQSNTQLRGLTSLTNGSTVRVRGLLFVDGGVFRLVASRIVAG